MCTKQIGNEDAECFATPCIVPTIRWTICYSVWHENENVQQLPAYYLRGGGRLVWWEEKCTAPALPGRRSTTCILYTFECRCNVWLTALSAHFSPAKIVVVEWHKFLQSVQRLHESFPEYVGTSYGTPIQVSKSKMHFPWTTPLKLALVLGTSEAVTIWLDF